MFAANAFGWPYLGQAYAGVGAANISASDTANLSDTPSPAAALTSGDTFSAADSAGTVNVVISSPASLMPHGGFVPAASQQVLEEEEALVMSLLLSTRRRRRLTTV